jgi:hypothetical protein
VKFEADLVLSMSISGLDLTSTTLFTFHGVEVQLFSAKATVGAMTFTTVLAFAPNILEFEDVRSSAASRGWCLRDTAPGPLPAAASCANGFRSRGRTQAVLGFFEHLLCRTQWSRTSIWVCGPTG